MAVIVRRLLVLPLIALYFVSAFCGEGLHSVFCHESHAETDPPCGHADHGDCLTDNCHGWHADDCHSRRADHARPVHDEQGCAVCQFLAKAQLTVAANQPAGSRPVQSALAARAPGALAVWSAASYDPRGPPVFSA